MKHKKWEKTLFPFLLSVSALMTSCLGNTSPENSSHPDESLISILSESDISSNESEFEESFDFSEDESSSASEDLSEDTTSEASKEESTDVSEETSEESSIDTELSYDPSYSEITIDSAGERYSDKFTDGEIIFTDTSYQSEFINVTLKEITYGGKLYYVEDIYIKNIESLYVGFAGLKFGKKYNDYVPDMVEDYKNAGHLVVGAINGDYCGLNGRGLIIRNGELYGTGIAEYTVCVLYRNGVMAIIKKEQFNAEKEIQRGAWHAWDFGPSFLEADGSPVQTFTERLSISRSNPRTAIGYFEPGHYCFITAGGRKGETPYGVSYKQISAFCNYLGCKVAYNLDGGESAVMVFGDKVVNEKNQGTGRRISDIIFIQDITKEDISE